MTTIEIILLIIGMLLLLGSFWVTEKLSPSELEHISELSKEEMAIMLEHELEKSKQKVVDIVEETIDASKDRTERALEKQTNEKIMAINEYSDTVIEKMNKTHNEIMFLYSMLNDKHTELTDFSNGINKQVESFKLQADEMADSCLEQLKQQAQLYALQTVQQVNMSTVTQQPFVKEQSSVQQEQAVTVEVPAEQQESDDEQIPKEVEVIEEEEEKQVSAKDQIFKLYEEGKDSVAIAKKLGMGVGEVRLILGLYKGEHVSEV